MANFGDENFEFWRDLPPSKVRYRAPEEFDEYREYETYQEEMPNYVEFKRTRKQERRAPSKRARSESRKIKACAALLVVLVGIGSGMVVKTVYPYAKGSIDYEINRITLANLYDSFSSNSGYKLSGDLVYKDRGFFGEGPRQIDFSSKENVWINESGKKEGPLVTYYDAFDEYVRKNTGDKGYYEIMYEQNEISELFGRSECEDCVYTQEELEEIVKAEKEKMEANNGKGLR